MLMIHIPHLKISQPLCMYKPSQTPFSAPVPKLIHIDNHTQTYKPATKPMYTYHPKPIPRKKKSIAQIQKIHHQKSYWGATWIKTIRNDQASIGLMHWCKYNYTKVHGWTPPTTEFNIIQQLARDYIIINNDI